MSLIDYQSELKVLVMTKGHPFSRDDFCAVFDSLPGVASTHVEQPAAQAFFDPALAKEYAAFVLYDMPGLDFTRPADDDGQAPKYIEPSASFKNNFLQLLEQGHGFVFLHHSIAAWPAWPEYARIVGGQFLYKTGEFDGVAYPDSGYRHEVDHQVAAVGEHPVTAGISSPFTINDELYLSHVYGDDVVPLLQSDYVFSRDNFYSAQQAVQGTMFSREGWDHPPGHNLIGWVKHYKNSPIVYLQCGDSKPSYDNDSYRKLLHNAISWVSSDEAKAWALQRNQSNN